MELDAAPTLRAYLKVLVGCRRGVTPIISRGLEDKSVPSVPLSFDKP